MAAFTSKASGNWTTAGQTTWNEVGTPGNGDTVSIGAGHTITIPDNAGTITVGPSYLGCPTAPSYSGTTAATTVPWSSGGANMAITVVDAGGKESILSPNQQQFFSSGVTKPRLTMPSLPSGASSFNVYLDNGSNGGVRRYATGLAGGATCDLTSANWLAGTNDYSTAAVPPNDAAAITLASTGKLVIGAASPTTPPTLVVRGDILSTQSGARSAGFYAIQMNPGTTLEFDASQATSPTVQKYCFAATNYSQANNYLYFNGTSANRVTVRSNASGGNGRVSIHAFTGSNQLIATYTDFLRLGDSTNPCIDFASNFASSSTSITNCTFTSYGELGNYTSGGLTTTSTLVLNDNVFTSGLGTRAFRVRSLTAISSGTREIKRNYFDLQVNDSSAGGSVQGFTIEYNVFASDFYMDTTKPWASFQYNVVRRVPADWDARGVAGNVTNCYWLCDGNVFNPKGFSLPNADTTVDGVILQCTGSSTAYDGDGIIAAGATSRSYTIKNSLVLPRSGDGLKSSMTLATISNAGPTATITHNTFMGSDAFEHGIQTNETVEARIGTFTSYKSNLYWDTSARGNHFNTATSGKNPPNDNILTPGNCTNNCSYNASTYSNPGKSSDGTYYSIPTTTTVPGANDVNVNPNFVDSTRNFEKYATTFGDSATVANTLSRLKADPATRIPLLLTYVRGGFAPTNSQLATAGHDGATIGAVAYVANGTFASCGGTGPTFNFIEV